MRFDILLVILLVVAGIYVMPSVIASFQGTHTWEVNATAGGMGLRCNECHSYILSEMTAGDGSDVFQAHRNAAGNEAYTKGLLNLEIDNTTDYGTCQLCHLAKMRINESHTQVVVRVCTDPNCHGSKEGTNNTLYYTGVVGPQLGNTSNVHGSWFSGMYSYYSSYRNETGAAYTKGYWACLGCHTHVDTDVKITEGTFAHNDASAARKRYL